MSIWNYKEIKKAINIDEVKLLTLNEGDTRIDTLKYNNTELILKREDLNPTGSWKDRGTAYKLTELISQNIKEAVLSSSGNAAISFLTYANQLAPEFKLNIVVSPNTNPLKLKKIEELVQNKNHQLYVTESTRKKSIELAASLKIPNLRASIDEDIVKGYWSLGFEIARIIKNNQAEKKIGIFVPVSSGTALVGLAQGLFMKIEQEHLMPEIYVCQTEAVQPIVQQMANAEVRMSNNNKNNSSLDTRNSTLSLADAIFDTIALRSPQILKIIKETNGDAFAITNDELLKAKNFVQTENSKPETQNLSYTSLLSVAGFLRTQEKGKEFDTVICIASGL